jgi:16S rRNA (cytidine1402-2'-O)-methyltransferase
MGSGKLSIVGTPIGNLGDITFRALWNLKECDVIYAEDTRVTLKLLNHYGVRKPVLRLDAATEYKKAGEVIERLEKGEHIAYVTDAGTPGISDPGARLVARVRAELPEIAIEAVPGPSALTAALSIAGVSADAFIFFGFLPHKKGRQTALKEIAKSRVPVVLYESPHRIVKLMHELEEFTPKRPVVLAREITKIHEEALKGIPSQLVRVLKEKRKDRGEFVVILA